MATTEVYPRGTVKGKESTPAKRGIALYREKREEFTVYLDGSIGVPSATEDDLIYHVDEEGRCTCPHYLIRLASLPTPVLCKHGYAATYYRALNRNRDPFRVPAAMPATPVARSCRRAILADRRVA